MNFLFGFGILDDFCHIAARHGWQFHDQTIHHDRWRLRFTHVGTHATVGDRAPAAIHNHHVADPCTCTGTVHLFTWEDPDNPVDDRLRLPRTVQTWPWSSHQAPDDGDTRA